MSEIESSPAITNGRDSNFSGRGRIIIEMINNPKKFQVPNTVLAEITAEGRVFDNGSSSIQAETDVIE